MKSKNWVREEKRKDGGRGHDLKLDQEKMLSDMHSEGRSFKKLVLNRFVERARLSRTQFR